MKRTDFYYDLPEELIAQEPLKDRSSSRLMILDKNTGEIEHKHFYDIVDELNEGDALILNDISARYQVEVAVEFADLVYKCFHFINRVK